mgnify:CR=1 FL=1
MEFSRLKNLFVVLVMITVLTAGVSFSLQNSEDYFTKQAVAVASVQKAGTSAQNSEPLPPPPPQKLGNPPEIIKAVYVTGWSAGNKSYFNYLSNLFKKTEINAVVVDIKDSSGFVSYASGAEEVKKYNLDNDVILDIDALVRFFHGQNIYVIGRIVVFEDPVYSKARPELAIYNKAKETQPTGSGYPDLTGYPLGRVLWQDNNGLSWLDPASKEVWDYNISLAKDVFYHGFDEINFDYIRFPTDGNTKNTGFPVWDEKKPMQEIIKEFFQYVRQELAGEKISADLFGLTTVNTNDMGIGQLLENAFENFDYIAPMVYPSHYAKNFIGFENPAEYPYEVIKYSMGSAISREKSFLKKQQDLVIKNSEAEGSPASEFQKTLSSIPVLRPLARFRPWLQDFDMGAFYNADMVKKEIKATQDALGYDFSGFMLWNPSNIYTQAAVLKPR